MSFHSIDYLRAEHHAIEKVLAELDSALEPLRSKSPLTPSQGAALPGVSRRLLDQLLPHMRKEERILYPALEEFLPRYEGPLAVLRGDHAVLLAHSERLHIAGEKLSAPDPARELMPEFHAAGRTTLRLARDHIYKQEIVFFPVIARFLSPALDAQLLARMEAVLNDGGRASARDSIP